MFFGARLYAGSAIFLLTLIYLTLSSAPSVAQYISEGDSLQHGVGGRSLLQTKTSCPIDFERQNYTILTSQCKGPDYLPKLCCAAFKQFACKFVQYINDLSNDCADTMFSYINLHGKYPPALFSSTCREGKEGLACDADAPDGSQNDSSGSSVYHSVLNFSILWWIVIINLLGLLVA